MRKFLLTICILINAFVNAQTKKEASKIDEYIYDKVNNLKIYQVQPANYNPQKQYPSIVIFHGGGWVMGEASWGFKIAKRYAKMGMMAFSVQYRLQDHSKEITPYEAVLDAQNAIRWIRKNSKQLSVKADKIAAYGWSAGAHLAACAAVFENLEIPNKDISSAPNLLLLDSPALSVMGYKNFKKQLLHKIDPIKISPAESVNKNTPPSIIVIGRTDTVTPLEGSQLFKDNMDKHGNECELIIYENVGHLFTPSSEPDNGWPNPDKKVVQDADLKMEKFLRKHSYLKG